MVYSSVFGSTVEFLKLNYFPTKITLTACLEMFLQVAKINYKVKSNFEEKFLRVVYEY